MFLRFSLITDIFMFPNYFLLPSVKDYMSLPTSPYGCVLSGRGLDMWLGWPMSFEQTWPMTILNKRFKPLHIFANFHPGFFWQKNEMPQIGKHFDFHPRTFREIQKCCNTNSPPWNVMRWYKNVFYNTWELWGLLLTAVEFTDKKAVLFNFFLTMVTVFLISELWSLIDIMRFNWLFCLCLSPNVAYCV